MDHTLAVSLAGIDITADTLVLGLFTGLVYAVLAAGLTLMYRATRVINFAYGEIGAFGAAVLAKLVLDYNWNFFLTLALVLTIGAAVGAFIELTVVRRLFHSPRLILLVATIGVAQVMFFAQAVLPGVDNVARYPSPINRTLEFGGVLLRSEHFMVLALVPAIIVALTIFLTRTPYGIAIRATAENSDAARLAGINVKRVSTLVWVLSAVLATLTAVLINPIRGNIVGSNFSAALGPGLLLRALAAALVGRMISLPLALLGGVLVGMIEAVLFVNIRDPGVADLALFIGVLVMVFLQRRGLSTDETGTWSLSQKVRPIPARLRSIWWVRRLPLLAGSACLAVAVVLPMVFTTSARLFLFTRVLLFAVIALSLTVLTGWGGQLSLGQFALVGVGSLGSAAFIDRGMPFGAAVFYATVGGVLVALAIGAPALRIRGQMLAVTTLAFAVAARSWIFTRDLFLGDDTVVRVPRPSWGFLDFSDPRSYYYMCLIFLVIAIFIVSRVRKSGIGRVLIAVRDNEAAAAAYTVSPAIAKLTAFAVSGALAALAGGLLAGLRVQFTVGGVGADAFGPEDSLRMVAMAIIGGLGSVAGSVMGAVYVLGLPALIEDSAAVRLLTSGVGLLVLLMYFPGGLAQLLYHARDALLDRAARQLPPEVPVVRPAVALAAHPGGNGLVALNGGAALRASDITVRFGGRLALNAVTLEAQPGETVGLIGSNGAGKSTLMNVISGFVRAEGGSVEVLGEDVTHLPPHVRAQTGMARVFQDARLFGDLTVREAIQVALEGRERSELVPSMLALPPALQAERRKATEADELIHYLGLGRYADAFISDLSTGTRRIAELACLLALRPRVLLLDEPTAGVAQRETEAFGPLIQRVQEELGATLLLIEHDIPLIMSLSDRVYCLAAGEVIAEGGPQDVRNNPKVIAAYLGTDERAIRRSGAAATPLDVAVSVVTEAPPEETGTRPKRSRRK
jgi:ABC-type branched-subunit amino acid transport system ATPase component/ABC-type branched-subunit amino acid transport system permease subunit